MTELESLIQALREQQASHPADEGALAGMLKGLLEMGRARIRSQPEDNVYYRAGYLTGHLMRWLFERGRVIDEPLRLIAIGYGSCLADPAGQAALLKPDTPMTAHSYAVIRVERELHGLEVRDERMLFGWLLEQTNTALTPALDAKFERLRNRRQAAMLARRERR